MSNEARVYVISESSTQHEALGISNGRAEYLINGIRKLLFNNLVNPFQENRLTQRSQMMEEASKMCENIQELGYVMYKLGYEQHHAEMTIHQREVEEKMRAMLMNGGVKGDEEE